MLVLFCIIHLSSKIHQLVAFNISPAILIILCIVLSLYIISLVETFILINMNVLLAVTIVFLLVIFILDCIVNDCRTVNVLLYFLGEQIFDERGLEKLQQHSLGKTSTYAYYFTQKYTPDPPNPMGTPPDWLKSSADHGDELPFMFGGPLIRESVANNDIWKRM